MSRRQRAVRLGPRDVVVERRAGGAVHLRSPHALPVFPQKITERLEHWARVAPDRVFLAQREGEGWRRLTYREALERARRVGQYLLDKKLCAERPLVVLSGNDLEHALLHLGAMLVGIPYAPISPAYSLVSTDFAKLRAIFELLTPGLAFVSDRHGFSKALKVVNCEVIDRLEEPDATSAVEEAHARVGPDTIAKFLFTSGSTGAPKAVINTQRMWCSNQAMILAALPFFADEPPVLLDWAPWHHTAAGNHDLGLALYNGGSYYIDKGRPLPGEIETTVRNLREVAPTWYFNVPKGFEMLLPFLKEDSRLRAHFFSRLQVLWFAGAALPQHVFDEMKELAYRTCGEEIAFLTGFGATETAPATLARVWSSPNVANMGLPPPGAELKLVPMEGRYEMRVKGPHVTPGYWRARELTERAFDAEGYYCIGDSFTFDRGEPANGLAFAGRIAEDFKLLTGTWVHVGELRARFIRHFAPLVRDVVLAGEGRSEIGALIFLSGPASREELVIRLQTLENSGSSNRITRAMVLEEPPSLDAGEATDKGSINQRAVLTRRKPLVEELFRDPPSAKVLWI
ncbi:MAG TPA: feruloyl-CoA synthase [Burkholderiales bacterium]|nr:feruloyl-CoA synthase [Burkholderiales bacterium]